ncbi:cyclin [Pisolithus croceorrhizus]|nr:cyclin [Pisolithus croceorrhizus]
MPNNIIRPSQTRTRFGARKANGDENATSKHLRQGSGIVGTGASRVSSALGGLKVGQQRPALNEVTTTAVNRKDVAGKPAAKDGLKDASQELGLKRTRSSSLAAATGPQRVPLGPTKTESAANLPRQAVVRAQKASKMTKRTDMDIEVPHIVEPDADPELSIINEREVESMVDVQDIEVEAADNAESMPPAPKSPRVWPNIDTDRAMRHHKEVAKIQESFEDEVDIYDTTMVSEYADDIFQYMSELEAEVTWSMRQTLVDWLLQVHLRWHMLPETLWIAINIVDRFLSKRPVALVKLQLVGVTAMFIAAKYEEIVAPSVDEFVYMTENGYTKEEILKGERVVLQTLEFKISQYCSPYSWMRRISKADNYDIQTRTLGKFIAEIALLDHRFLRCKPSLISAVAMYSARKMLGGDWNDAFVFYSGFVDEHLEPGHRWICEKLLEENSTQLYVCQKYAHKKFLKASLFAIDWAKNNWKSTNQDSSTLKK